MLTNDGHMTLRINTWWAASPARQKSTHIGSCVQTRREGTAYTLARPFWNQKRQYCIKLILELGGPQPLLQR